MTSKKKKKWKVQFLLDPRHLLINLIMISGSSEDRELQLLYSIRSTRKCLPELLSPILAAPLLVQAEGQPEPLWGSSRRTHLPPLGCTEGHEARWVARKSML